MTDQPGPAPAYLDPLHDELDRLRTENAAILRRAEHAEARLENEMNQLEVSDATLAEAEAARDEFEKSYVHFHNAYNQAEARVNNLHAQLDEERAFNQQRSDALNRTGASNDTLRAKVEAVRALHRERKILEDCPTDGCDRDDCAEGDEAGIALHWNDVIDRVCAECNDGYEDAISWPCPTIAALADQETK